jgi:hypothetical protein
MELYTQSVIEFLSSPSTNILIARNLIHSGSVTPQVLIDGQATLAHKGLVVEGNVFPSEVTSGSICLNPGGSTSTFTYRMNVRNRALWISHTTKGRVSSFGGSPKRRDTLSEEHSIRRSKEY